MRVRPIHLVRRFFEVLFARPLKADELTQVAGWIGPELFTVFVAQQTADQRHGHHTALRVVEAGYTDPVLISAAALHDVGKRHSGLGAVGRSLATVMMVLGLPMRGRMAAYRDHGVLGAVDLERLGAPNLVVLFARHHQVGRPDSIHPSVWAVLHHADLATLPRGRDRGGISSPSG